MLLVTSYSLSIVLIINFILTFIIIFLERKDPQSTYAWLLFIWIIPALGFLFYLIFSQNIARRKIFKLYCDELEITNKLLNQQKNDLISDKIVFEDSFREQYKDIIHFHQNISNSLYTNNNQIKIFTDGKEKFKNLFENIDKAKDHIHAEYFIIKNDDLGKSFIELLTKKANQGVEVRLLYDDLGGRFISNEVLKEFLAAGGKIGRFFPSKLKYINFKANYRNHRKIVVIDGKVGYIGGFNVGDEYLGLKKKMGYWRDTHIRISGGAVYELQLRFLLDWRSATNEDVRLTSKFLTDDTFDGDIGIQIVSSGPDDVNEQVKQGYLKIINSARKYIFIQTPYFIPDQSMLEALKIAAKSGIDVRIMIPNKPDHMFVYWATYSYVGDLVKYGAKAYIYNNGFLHSKTIISDDAISSVGTCNFDIRSFRLNFEANAFIYDQDIATELRDIFYEDMQVCTEVGYEEYKKRTIIIKLKESISRLFSPVL